MPYLDYNPTTRRLERNSANVSSNQDVTATNSSGATIAANTWVNLYDASGVLTMRKADAGAADLVAYGITIAAVNTAATGTVRKIGLATGLTGLTNGADYFSDPATPGGHTTTPGSNSNTTIQYLGTAEGTTSMRVRPDNYKNTVRIL